MNVVTTTYTPTKKTITQLIIAYKNNIKFHKPPEKIQIQLEGLKSRILFKKIKFISFSSLSK